MYINKFLIFASVLLASCGTNQTMKTVSIFEKGEKVRIEFYVSKIVLRDDEIKYELNDPRTGRDFDYLFTADQMIPVDELHEVTA